VDLLLLWVHLVSAQRWYSRHVSTPSCSNLELQLLCL